ncbi:TRAP transporter small permease [Thermodesulfobacteriota bacterium]
MKLARIGNLFDRILDIAAFLAAAMIAFAAVVVCAEVLIRYFIGETLPWVIDICAILLLYVTLLSAAWLSRSEGHVIMDLLINRLNPRYKLVLNIFTSIVGAIIFGFLTWYGAKTTWIYYKMGYWMPTTLETPKFLVLIIIPIGSFLLFIQLIRKTCSYLRSRSSLLVKEENKV